MSVIKPLHRNCSEGYFPQMHTLHIWQAPFYQPQPYYALRLRIPGLLSASYKRILFSTVILLSVLLLSGCEEWDDFLCDVFDSGCEDSPPLQPGPGAVETLLSEINEFKQGIATGAGNNSTALRPFQTAEVGDIWIRNFEDGSLQNYIGNASTILAFDNSDKIRSVKNLSSLNVEFEWKRSYSDKMDVGFEFVNAALRTAFSFTDVDRIRLRISVIDAGLQQFVEPGMIYDSYQNAFGDNEIKGNILITGIVTGRIRIEFSAFNSSGELLDVSSSLMAENINGTPGISTQYAVESSSSSSFFHGAVEESFDDSSVFAVTYLSVSPEKQDQLFIRQQLSEDASTPFVKRLPVYDTITGLAIAQFEMHQERSGSEADEQIKWFLTVKNVSQPPISYFLSYNLIFSNFSGSFLFASQGTIDRLDPGQEVSEGLISDEKILLKFVTVDPTGTTYTQLD